MTSISPWVIGNALRSEHLVYRAIENTPEDVDFLSALMGDPYVQAYAGRHMLRPLSKKKTQEMIPKIHASALVGSVIMLAPPPNASEEGEAGAGTVSTKDREGHETKKPLEAIPIGYLGIGGDLVPEHMHIRDTEIGILLREEYRGKGYGTEAVTWAVDWAFRNANMRRVSIACYEQNAGAERLYKKLGFVEEGRRRKKIYHDMKWYDEVLLGMLREEWLALRRLKPDGEMV